MENGNVKRKNFGKKKFTTAHTLKLSPSPRGKEQAVPVAYKVQPDLIRYHGVEGAEDAEVMDLSHLVVEVCEMINEMINGNEN